MGDSLPRLSEVLAARDAQPPQAWSMVNYVRTLALARSTRPSLVATAGERYLHDDKLQSVLKAAVQAGTLSNMAELAPYRVISNEFVAASRASSIVGRLDARRVPLRIKVPKATTGSTSSWIGEGSVKPISVLSMDEILLDPKKNSTIVVITDELARFSSPGSDALLRADLIAACNAAIDTVFVGTSAATSSTPGGILAGVSPVTSTGSTSAAIAADVRTVIAGMITAGGMVQSPVILAHPSTWALVGISLGAGGGSLGIPTLTSSAVPAGKLIVVDQAELLLGDDGGIELSLATEASVMMDSAPVDGTTAYVSLWQKNLVAIRAERFINWVSAHSNSATAGAVVSIA